jgi:hypothetical protein
MVHQSRIQLGGPEPALAGQQPRLCDTQPRLGGRLPQRDRALVVQQRRQCGWALGLLRRTRRCSKSNNEQAAKRIGRARWSVAPPGEDGPRPAGAPAGRAATRPGTPVTQAGARRAGMIGRGADPATTSLRLAGDGLEHPRPVRVPVATARGARQRLYGPSGRAAPGLPLPPATARPAAPAGPRGGRFGHGGAGLAGKSAGAGGLHLVYANEREAHRRPRPAGERRNRPNG